MADDFDDALEMLVAELTARLAPDGWIPRDLDRGRLATFTRAGGGDDGVLLVAELDRFGFSFPERWPLQLEATTGVGYSPALDLMPLLTLRADPILASSPDDDRLELELARASAVSAVADRVAAFVESTAAQLAARFPDTAAVETQVRRDAEYDEPHPEIVPVERELLVFLAATGQGEELGRLLDDYESQDARPHLETDERRLIRQLRRRLDAGLPTPPPVEQTVAQLPRQAPLHSFVWSSAWSKAKSQSRARRDAVEAVRRQARGKTIEELREMLTVEYARHGSVEPQSVVEVNAHLLLSEQRPFGRLRRTIEGVQTLIDMGRGAVHQVRQAGEAAPAWLRPPERAAYPLVSERNSYVAARVDEGATDQLERVMVEPFCRIGPVARCEAWLIRESAQDVAVHIGAQRVGIITGADADAFSAAFRAAALYDEDPLTTAHLLKTEEGGFVLEVPRPLGPPG